MHDSISVAVIGLGRMGSAIARRILHAGFALTVHNRSTAKAAPLLDAGARWADSPREAAAVADVVIFKSIVVALAAVLLALGMIRQREFRVNRLWIQPVAVSIMLVLGLYGSSLSPPVLAAIVLGVCVGGGLGIVRAKVSLDRIDVSKRCIITKPNVWMAVVFAAAFALKFLVGHGPASSSFRELTDFLMCMTATSICAQRWQFYRTFRASAAG